MRWTVSSCLMATLLVAPVAFADVGPDLSLTVTPDDPVGGGDTVTFDLSGGDFFSLAFLAAGDTLGSSPFGEVTLDVLPDLYLFLGLFPSDGSLSTSFALPDTLPPELSGLIFHLQGASVGINFEDFTLTWRKSNLDSLSFE